MGKKFEYKAGTIWVMPQALTQKYDPKRPNEKIMVPISRPTYIIITADCWMQNVGETNRDFMLDGEIHAAELNDDSYYEQNERVCRYKLIFRSRICPTWFLGSIKPITEEQMPDFKKAFAEATAQVEKDYQKRLFELQQIDDLVKTCDSPLITLI